MVRGITRMRLRAINRVDTSAAVGMLLRERKGREAGSMAEKGTRPRTTDLMIDRRGVTGMTGNTREMSTEVVVAGAISLMMKGRATTAVV